MRVIEYRLEQLIIHPPRWEEVWPRVRPYLLGVGGLAVAGFAIWSFVNWLGTPSPPPPSSAGGLPYEAIADRITRSVASFQPFIIVLGMIIAATSILSGEGRRAYLGLAMVFSGTLMGFGSRLFDDLSVSESSRSLVATQASTAEKASQAAPSAEAASIDDATEAPHFESTPSSALSSGSGASFVREEPGPTTPATGAHAANHEDDSHFGVGDALMMYGAYRLLTSENRQHSPTVVHAPTSERAQPAPVVAPPPAARSQPPASPHVSAPAAYKPFSGRVSPIRTSPVRSAPVFRSSGRRSR